MNTNVQTPGIHGVRREGPQPPAEPTVPPPPLPPLFPALSPLPPAFWVSALLWQERVSEETTTRQGPAARSRQPSLSPCRGRLPPRTPPTHSRQPRRPPLGLRGREAQRPAASEPAARPPPNPAHPPHVQLTSSAASPPAALTCQHKHRASGAWGRGAASPHVTPPPPHPP